MKRRQGISGTIDLVYRRIYASSGIDELIHWSRDEIYAILQTPCSIAFSRIKMYEFRLKFHWSLFLRVQLTVGSLGDDAFPGGTTPLPERMLIYHQWSRDIHLRKLSRKDTPATNHKKYTEKYLNKISFKLSMSQWVITGIFQLDLFNIMTKRLQ